MTTATSPQADAVIDTSESAVYKRLFDNAFQDLEKLLTDLPNEALLWKPFEQSPWQGPSSSVGFVVAHALSSTVYLLRRAEYAMGRCEWSEVEGDEGSEEFGPANHDVGYLLARAKRTQDFVHQFLASVDSTNLSTSRAHPKRATTTFIARQDAVHALDHLTQHIGHGQLTRQLWAIQAAE